MEAMLKEYREAIQREAEKCTDAFLLDLVYKLFVKSREKEGTVNNG
jgi:hypothetical protein